MLNDIYCITQMNVLLYFHDILAILTISYSCGSRQDKWGRVVIYENPK